MSNTDRETRNKRQSARSAQAVVAIPPSTGTTVPVRYDPAAGEEHGDTGHVVVAADPAQRADAAIASPNSSRVAAIIFDGNGPGATAFTVTCCGPSSLASTLVS